MHTLKIYDIRWTSHTAGPSPVGDDNRTELFLMGCKKATSGYPCRNCFNSKLWKDIPDARKVDATEAAEHITEYAPNKFITIVGGEPLDQMDGLIELCEGLKKNGFHIIVFTHYEMQNMKDDKMFKQLIRTIDILVDGEYQEDLRIYDESKEDGVHNAIGSANQIVWDLEYWNAHNHEGEIMGQKAGDLHALYVCPNGELRYIIEDNAEETNKIQFAAA